MDAAPGQRCFVTGKLKMRFVPVGDSVETDCIGCGETLLVDPSDQMSLFVGQNADGTTEVFGIYCARCARAD